jgi:hypothetical protein
LGTLGFSQVSFFQWASGGETSYSGNGFVNVFGNYRRGKISWDNTLNLGYGMLKQGSYVRKSDDRIEFSSKCGVKASEKWNYSAITGVRTQFSKGFNYPDVSTKISSFFSPAYVNVAAGMDFRPADRLSIFVSTVSGKMTFVVDDSLSMAGEYGVDSARIFRAELGGFAKLVYKLPLVKNVDLLTRIDMFSNYCDKPENIDFNAEFLITMKINEFMAATLNALLIYDDDVTILRKDKTYGPGLQMKEVFGIGLSRKF